MGSPCRGMPRQGLNTPAQREFPDLTVQYPANTGISGDEIGAIMDKAAAGDCDHLLKTAMR